MKTRILHLMIALAAAPLLAQDYAITGSNGVITAVPLQTDPEVRHANLPWRELTIIEDAFTNGTQSLDTLVSRINRLPGGGGFDWIEEHGFDPSQLTDPKTRAAFTPIIEAVEYDNRLQNLIDGVNAAIADEEKQKQQKQQTSASQQTAEEKAWYAAVRDSKRRARQYYPDLRDRNSALSKKWVEIAAQLEAAKDPLVTENNPDFAFIVTVRAANLLGIKPVSP